MTQFRLRRPDEFPSWRAADRATRMQIMRALSGMSQVEVAHIASVATNTVQRSETHPNGQLLETLERVLEALGFDLLDLLANDPPTRR